MLNFRPPQNQGNAHLNLENSSLKKCPKPSGQGFRPPPPYGQCPNRVRANLTGASLTARELLRNLAREEEQEEKGEKSDGDTNL